MKIMSLVSPGVRLDTCKWINMCLLQIQINQPLKASYSEKLGKLESQYGKLLVSIFHLLFKDILSIYFLTYYQLPLIDK